jgi:ADP-ribose pyrophosphatase
MSAAPKHSSPFAFKAMSDEYRVAPQVGVGAVVFHENKILLVKRARPPAQGQWAIPGGRLEVGETLQRAAEREILEEAGICIRARHPLYTFDMIERDDDGSVRFHYVIVDLAAEYISGEPRASDDAIEARWLSADELRSLPVSNQTLALLRELHFL